VFAQGEWLPGTANTVPKGRWEIGLFQPVRWGQSENREISFYKLSNLLMPGVTIKQRWGQPNSWIISTTHSLYYPTPLLKMVAKEGIGGMISPEFEIPHLLSLWNMVLASKPLAQNKILTTKIGFSLAFGGRDLSKESTIDLPLVYHRLAVYYKGWLLRFGSDLNGQIGEKWSYLIDGDYILIPGMKGYFTLEHKGMLSWKKSSTFLVSIGYKLIYGLYPDGYPNNNIARFHVLPLLDFQWAVG
ncbi:uncharacterized protein METZ01_LOCUS233262, partial [marine metagenome]